MRARTKASSVKAVPYSCASMAFDSLDAARDKAIRLFSSGDYSDVRVEDEDGDDVVNMTM